MMKTLIHMLLFAVLPILALAQKPVTRGEVVEITAEIVAIDHDARLITLEDEDGETEEIYAGPDVKRFDELKVGDEVTFRYYESIVSQIRKPGESAPVRFRRTDPRSRDRRQAVGDDIAAVDRHSDHHGDGRERAVGDGENRGRPHDELQGRGQEEPRRRQGG